MGLSSAPSLPYLATRKPGRYAFKLLFSRWDGSMYKLVWRNLVVWLVLYYALSLWYRLGMTSDQQRIFEMISHHCEKHNSYIPLAFVLGFYVTTVIGRWWVHWDNLAWPDAEAFWLSCVFRGMDEQSVMLRRTVMRYMSLTSIYTQCLLSPRIRKKFPTLDHFVEAGLMNENERKIFERLSENGAQKLYYMPIQWAGMIVTRAKEITDVSGRPLLTEMQWKSCMDNLGEYRARCSRALLIEIQNVPIVYSQIVALAVYAFSALCLLGRQFLLSDEDELDMYFPFLTILQLVFHWGWLKVAETMIDPYGEDDADIPLIGINERNAQVSDNMALKVLRSIDDIPDMVRDDYWNFDARTKPQSPSDADEPAAKSEGQPSPRAKGIDLVMGLDGGGNSVDIGIDGILADIPPSRATWRELEERAWAQRGQRKSTLRRIIGSLRHRHGNSASRVAHHHCHHLHESGLDIPDGKNRRNNLDCHHYQRALGQSSAKRGHNCKHPPPVSGSRQQLCTVDSVSADDGDNEGVGQRQLVKPVRQTKIGTIGEDTQSPVQAKSEALVKRTETFSIGKEVSSDQKQHHEPVHSQASPTRSKKNKSLSSGAIPSKHQHVNAAISPEGAQTSNSSSVLEVRGAKAVKPVAGSNPAPALSNNSSLITCWVQGGECPASSTLDQQDFDDSKECPQPSAFGDLSANDDFCPSWPLQNGTADQGPHREAPI